MDQVRKLRLRAPNVRGTDLGNGLENALKRIQEADPRGIVLMLPGGLRNGVTHAVVSDHYGIEFLLNQLGGFAAKDRWRHTVSEPPFEKGSHPVRLIHDLTHESLAHMIGSTRQVVNKHLQAMHREGVLDSRSNRLAVSNLEALKEQADAFLSHDHK